MFPRPWQHWISESVDANDRNEWNILVCRESKTRIEPRVRSMCTNGFGVDLTACESYLIVETFCEIMSSRTVRDPRCVFFRMPTKSEDSPSLFAAIDALRGGKVNDPRYKRNSFWFFPPQVWFISDVMPDFESMGSNSFRVYTLTVDDALIMLKKGVH